MAFTKVHFPQNVPVDMDTLLAQLKRVGAATYGYCTKFNHPKSRRIIFDNSEVVAAGHVMTKLAQDDVLGEKYEQFFFQNNFTREHLEFMRSKQEQSQQKFDPQVAKPLWIKVNCMQQGTNRAFLELVTETKDLENIFKSRMLHGAGLSLGKLVGGGGTYSGSIHAFTDTGHFGLNAHPWEMMVFGKTTNIMGFLKHLAVQMSCWRGDDIDFDLDDYPTPLMISTMIRWTSNVDELWEYPSHVAEAQNIASNAQHLFDVWTNRRQAGKSHVLMTKKFNVAGFSVDALMNSASAMLQLSVCALIIRPMLFFASRLMLQGLRTLFHQK